MAVVADEVISAGSAVAIAEGMRQVSPDVLIVCPRTCAPAIETVFTHTPSAGLVRRYVTTDSPEDAAAEASRAASEGRRVMLVTAVGGDAAAALDQLARLQRLPAVIAALPCEPAEPTACYAPPAQNGTFVQLYTETPQEAYDTLIQAVRVAEHPSLRVPVTVVAPGGATTVAYNGGGAVRAFTGSPPAVPGSVPRLKARLALAVVRAFGDEYGRRFGRHYAVLDSEGMAGAELAVVAVGADAAVVRPVLRRLRSEGMRVGLLRPRVVCPFPSDEVAGALRRTRAVAVVACAAAREPQPLPYLYQETATALQAQAGRPALSSCLYTAQHSELAELDIARAVMGLQQAATRF